MKIKLMLAGFLISFTFAASATETSGILHRAEAGNLMALNQAFALLTKSDGAGAEEICISIGKSIPNHPRNFLTALKKNHGTQVLVLDSILGGLGEDYVDDLKKQKNELENRLKAIQTVNDVGLQTVRSECEARLKKQIQQRARE